MANVIQKIIGKVVRSVMQFSGVPMSDPQIASVFLQWLGGMGDTVENVTPVTAQTISAVYQAVGIHSRTLASLPLKIYKKDKKGAKSEATDHPLYQILAFGVNQEMDTFQFLEAMVGHLHLRGNCYALKYINPDGSIDKLVLLHPERVIAIRDIATGVLYYKVADMHGVYHDFPRANVLHIKNRSEDGVYGLSTIQMARHDVDRQMQMQKFGSHFFRNQARPAGLLEHPGNLSKPAAERLRESWQATYAGAENAGKVAILEENMTFKQLTVAPADAQFIEQEGAGVIDIARWFNLPQHMLGAMNNATFSNMEQQALEFVRLTVFPEARRFEAAMNFQLLTPFERKKGYFIRYDLNGLLRADTATRFTSYAIGRQWGFYSADDVREIEHLNPIPDGAGEIYWQPTNMVDASEEKEDPQPLPAPGPGGLIQVPTTQPVQAPQPAGQGDAPGGAPVNTQPGKKPPGKRFAMDMIEFDMRHEPDKLFLIRTRKAYTRIFERQIGDLLTKEAKFVDRIAKKCAKDRDVGDFRKQVESFYVSHQPLCANAMLDPMIALGEQLGEMTSSNEVLMRKLSENWAEDHCRTNRERVIDLIEKMPASDLLPAINELAKQWQEREFAKLAEKEVTTVLNTLEIAA